MGQNFFDPFGIPYFFLGEVFLVPLYDFYFHPLSRKLDPYITLFVILHQESLLVYLYQLDNVLSGRLFMFLSTVTFVLIFSNSQNSLGTFLPDLTLAYCCISIADITTKSVFGFPRWSLIL